MDGEHHQHQHQQPYDTPALPVPPPPFADFDFTFNPASLPQMPSFSDLQNLHAQSLLAPPHDPTFDAAGLFDFNFGGSTGAESGHAGDAGSGGVPPLLLSSTEETSLLGFLDKFSGDGFEFGPVKGMPDFPGHHHVAPGGGMDMMTGQGGSNHGGLGLDVHSLQQMHPPTSASGGHHATPTTISPHETTSNYNAYPLRAHSSSFSQPLPPTSASSISPNNIRSSPADEDPSPRPAKRRKSSAATDLEPPPSASSAASKQSRKPLLSEPQKRWNHIQSEQRRRTVIKENFSTLETLVAADKRYKGPHPTLPVPLDANGKPKKGVKAKSLRGKGKMGTLFRAAEFIAFLEQGIDS
ncbi:hypothetical protein FRB90_003597, partial [Tulasnella sp. 427]